MGAYSVHQHSTGHLHHNGSQLLPSVPHSQRQVDAELHHEGRRCRSRRKGNGQRRKMRRRKCKGWMRKRVNYRRRRCGEKAGEEDME